MCEDHINDIFGKWSFASRSSWDFSSGDQLLNRTNKFGSAIDWKFRWVTPAVTNQLGSTILLTFIFMKHLIEIGIFRNHLEGSTRIFTQLTKLALIYKTMRGQYINKLFHLKHIVLSLEWSFWKNDEYIALTGYEVVPVHPITTTGEQIINYILYNYILNR